MFRNRFAVLVVTVASLVAASCTARSEAQPPVMATTEAGAPSGSADRPIASGASASNSSTAEEQELDRLIELFGARADDRGESLDHRAAASMLLRRATLHADVSDYARARDRYAAALALAPDDPESLLGLGRASLGIHDFAAGRDAAARLLAMDPGSVDAHALAGDAALAVGDFEGAGEAFGYLATSVGDDPSILVRRAQLELLVGDATVARGLATDAIDRARALDVDPRKLAYYESFAGNMAHGLGDDDAAATLLESAIEHAPMDQGALGELARVRAATGDVDAAIELFSRANALVPEPDHLVLEGDLLGLRGDDDAAADRYRAALDLANRDEDHRRAWSRTIISYHLDHDGDLDVALEASADELSRRDDPGAWELRAWALHGAGDLDGARSAIDEAVARGNPSASIWYHAGVISADRGEVGRATDELTRALDLNPGFDLRSARRARMLLDELGG